MGRLRRARTKRNLFLVSDKLKNCCGNQCNQGSLTCDSRGGYSLRFRRDLHSTPLQATGTAAAAPRRQRYQSASTAPPNGGGMPRQRGTGETKGSLRSWDVGVRVSGGGEVEWSGVAAGSEDWRRGVEGKGANSKAACLCWLMVRRLLAASLVFNGGRGKASTSQIFFFFFWVLLAPPRCPRSRHVDRLSHGVSGTGMVYIIL